MEKSTRHSTHHDSDTSYEVGVDDTSVSQFHETIRGGDRLKILKHLEDLGTADIADLIQKLSDDDRQALFDQNISSKLDPEVFSELDPDLRKSILSHMPDYKVAAIVSELESDDALDLIENLDRDFQKSIIKKLSAKTRVAMEEGLTFPEDSAGRLMQREYVSVPHIWTVGKTFDYLRAAANSGELPDEFYDIIVIDPAHHIVGKIPLSRLVSAKRTDKIEKLCQDSDVHTIPATMDQEEVAHIFRRENLGSAPVVDEDGRLIGVITVDDVIDVIDEEAHEDILKLAGVEDSDMYRAILSTSSSRFKWLFINLFTAILASVTISLFDDSMKELIALAILMPIVASMGGNAGTQALAVAVRGLATKELSKANMYRMIGKEIAVGALNGTGFAIIMGLVVTFWFSYPMLGVVIGAALILNMVVAGLFGASIPIIINQLGGDPAIASSIFLTTATDIIGFLGFLGLASVFLL